MKIDSKKWLAAGVATLAIASVLFARELPAIGGPQSVYAAEQNGTDKHYITVNGKGEMTVAPDVAYIQLGVRTEAATAKEAQEANAKAFAKIRSVLFEQYKLAEKDVKTSGFRVQPEYSYTDRDPKIKGYSAVQMLQVTYRDLDQLGTFLDAVTAAGANQINGIQFGTEKGDEYELQVIEKALDNAKAKAEAIAKYAGKPLKGIVAVNQGGGVSIPTIRSDYAVAEKALLGADSAVPTEISAGELKITTTVTVQFEF
jgi:uncharacterized protein YggE